MTELKYCKIVNQEYKEGSTDFMDRTYLCIEKQLNPMLFKEDRAKLLLFGLDPSWKKFLLLVFHF